MPSLPQSIVGIAMGLLMLTGCANTPSTATLNEVRSTSNPTDRAQRNITNFTPALRCMDDMMFNLGTRDVSMMMEEFRDATQKVPVSGRDMLTSAISDMSRRSRGVRLSVFGSDQQNLTQFLQQAQKSTAFAVIPQYNIRGTISQFDESVKKSSTSFGASLAESLFGIRLGSDTKFSALGLDAAVVETSTMTLMPGVSSKNTTVIASRDASAGDGLAKLVNPGIGLVFAFASSRADGPAQAARNMIELASVELVGKLIRAPYWQCLGTPDSDPEIQREMDDWYLSMDDEERVVFFKERMRERRYYDGALDAVSDGAFTTALQSYRSAMKLSSSGPVDQNFFKQFVTTSVPRGPLAAPARTSAAVATTSTASSLQTSTTAQILPAAAIAPSSESPAGTQVGAPPLVVTLNAPVPVSGKNTAPASLTIEVARAGYVYCYAQDGVSGRIQRIFPNRFTRDSRLSPGKAIVLPGRAAFNINPAAQYACMHAPREVYGDLPPPLRWGDFEDVRLPSFNAIREQFSLAAGAPVQLVGQVPGTKR